MSYRPNRIIKTDCIVLPLIECAQISEVVAVGGRRLKIRCTLLPHRTVSSSLRKFGAVPSAWDASCMFKVPPYLTRWRPDPDDDEANLRSAFAVARFALASPDLTPKHRIRLLNDAIWYRTEAVSKIRLRYRSGGVQAPPTSGSPSWRSMLRHDHVQTRAALVRQMTERPEDVERILGAAVACLVTKTEHEALGRYDTRAEGWDRYRMAGVDVYDFSTDPPTPIVINESANQVAP